MTVDRRPACQPARAQREAQQHDARDQEKQRLAEQCADRAPEQDQDRNAEHRVANNDKCPEANEKAARDQGHRADEHGDRNQHAAGNCGTARQHQRDRQGNGAGRDDRKPPLVPVPCQYREGRERERRRDIGKADMRIDGVREDD